MTITSHKQYRTGISPCVLLWILLWIGLSLGAKAQQQEANTRVASIIASISESAPKPIISDSTTTNTTQVKGLGKGDLCPLLHEWKPTLSGVQTSFVFKNIIRDEVFDSTIYSCLLLRNRQDSDSRIAYLNTAILYASIWDGATAPPNAPRRDWGVCSVEMLDIWSQHFDDTVTMRFKLTGNYDFVKGAIAMVMDSLLRPYKEQLTTEEEYTTCMSNLFPDDSIAIPMNSFHKANFIVLASRALAQTPEGKRIIAVNQDVGFSSRKLLSWYKKYRNRLLWDRKGRCFILRKV